MALSSSDALNMIASLAVEVSENHQRDEQHSTKPQPANDHDTMPLQHDELNDQAERGLFEYESGTSYIPDDQSEFSHCSEVDLLMRKELRNLQFENPGNNAVLADFSSMQASRSRRRAQITDNERKRNEEKEFYHDEKGRLVVNGECIDMCDCLRKDCQGCHWPCEGCGSRRCGPDCRVNREFTYVEVSDPALKDYTFRNPYVQE